MFQDTLKYLAVAAVVLLVPVTWLIVREILANAPVDIDQALFHNEVKARCVERNPCEVTIKSLLENPISFDGTFVGVSGVIRIEFEGEYLYATHEDYEEGNSSNAVRLRLNEEHYEYTSLNGCNVEVLGKVVTYPKYVDAVDGEHLRSVRATLRVIEIGVGGS